MSPLTRRWTGGHADRHFFGMVDLFLLTRSDDMIITSWSTYGYVAAGFASIVPRIATEVRRGHVARVSMPRQRGKSVGYAQVREHTFRLPGPNEEALYGNIPIWARNRSERFRIGGFLAAL